MFPLKANTFRCILIVLVCFAFYGNTIQNDYAYDDSVVITENAFTQKGVAGIPEIFGNNTFRGSYDDHPTVKRYRPLTLATFAVEHQFFGLNPHVSHFNNVLLLILASLSLDALLSKVFARTPGLSRHLDFPLIAVLLFIAHPVHTEVVANIKGRDELLVLLGASSATLFVLKYRDTRELRFLRWSFFSFLVALFSKENAITFLGIVPLTIYYYNEEKWSTYVRSMLPFFAASAVFLAATWMALGRAQPQLQSDIITEPFTYATASQRFATVFYTFGIYLKLLVFPHPLTIDYYPFHIKLANWNSPIVWVSLLTYVALGAYAALNLRRRSVVAYGIAFYLLSFSIVSNLPFSVGTFMSERFLFIPSLGFVIALAWFLSTKVFQVIQHEKLILATISLVCLTKTYHRNGQWKNDFTLFTADIGTSSNSIKGNLAASVSYLEESQRVGDSELATRYRSSALEHSKKAISLYESFVDAQHLRGTSYDHALTLLCDCYSVNGLLEDALSCYKQALRIVSNRVQLCATIETTIDKSPDLDFKLRSYTEFADLVPDNFLFAYRLGYLYGKEKNDLARSIQYLQRAVRIDPKETHALEALSHAYKLSKDYEKAAFYLEKATAESPNSLSHLTRLLAIYKLARNREKQSEIELRIGELQQ